MPRDEPRLLAWGGVAILLGVVVLPLGLLAWAYPISLLLIVAFLAVNLIVGAWHRDGLRQLVKVRPGESICTFARSFDTRAIDTRILRATYEEVHDSFWTIAEPLPLRRSDRFEADFHMDPEELDDMAYEIARRSGRSLEGSRSNPYYDETATVGGLVLFLNDQPEVG